NPDLARGSIEQHDFLHEEKVFEFLEKRRGLLEGVVITGGEPTLHPDLLRICAKIRGLGYPVKLDTNGSKPNIVKKLIDSNLINYVAMDIKTAPDNYSPLIWKKAEPEKILASTDIIMNSGLDYEFRTTCLKPFIDQKSIKKISGIIKGARLYALQRCNDKNVLDRDFFNNNDRLIKEDEFQKLKLIASEQVDECIIRG
nr:anaerobic ribonucleoside-triphosphate reductase activating protein [Desulfobacterales bacterium]